MTAVSEWVGPEALGQPGFPDTVHVYEVGPRDGLQAERTTVPTAHKLAFIEGLRRAGLPRVEATSFVSPRWIPQLADAEEVMAGLGGDEDAHHPVLVPNEQGLQRAVESGAGAVAVFVSATESFARRNLNRSREQVLDEAARVAASARERGMWVRGYVSMCFGDPWEGAVDPEVVVSTTRALVEAGCHQVSLGDTIGVGTVGHVDRLLQLHRDGGVSSDRLALHFHDTYGQALANVHAGLLGGVTCFDSSAGGIGGCPYAGSATGNLATEDLVWLLHGLGIETGVDLLEVARVGASMTDRLGRPRGRVASALLDA